MGSLVATFRGLGMNQRRHERLGNSLNYTENGNYNPELGQHRNTTVNTPAISTRGNVVDSHHHSDHGRIAARPGPAPSGSHQIQSMQTQTAQLPSLSPATAPLYEVTDTSEFVTKKDLQELILLCQKKFTQLETMLEALLDYDDHDDPQSNLYSQQIEPDSEVQQTDSGGPQASNSRWPPLLSIFHRNKQCPNCDYLTQEIAKRDAKIKKLASQMNAEVGKMQGNFGHNSQPDAISHADQEFNDFFTSQNGPVEAFSKLVDVAGDDKKLLREKLCTVFQEVFDKVKELLLNQIRSNLAQSLFKASGFRSDQDPQYNDYLRAYSRLLSADRLTGECKIGALREMVQVSTETQEMFKSAPLKSVQSSERKKFIDKCIILSWRLLTNVPPLLAQCPKDEKYDSTKHKKVPGPNSSTTCDTQLHFLRPHLTSCIADKTYDQATVYRLQET